MDACPDASGKVTVESDVDSTVQVTGKPGTGGYVRSHFVYERYLDDDAHLVWGPDGSSSNMRIAMGGTENGQSQQVDLTTGWERGGTGIFSNHHESGFSIFRMEEVERTRKMVESAQLLQTLMAEVMLRGMKQAPQESGRCILLDASSTPSRRTGVKPSTSFDVVAAPRVKSDGSVPGGSVRATLSGGESLTREGEKLAPDAQYTYTAPAKKDQVASIAFEARSRRGVGRASLAFDTRDRQAYRIKGGQNDFVADTVVCSLGQPFNIPSSAGLVMHMSGGDGGGTWTLSGQAAGVTYIRQGHLHAVTGWRGRRRAAGSQGDVRDRLADGALLGLGRTGLFGHTRRGRLRSGHRDTGNAGRSVGKLAEHTVDVAVPARHGTAPACVRLLSAIPIIGSRKRDSSMPSALGAARRRRLARGFSWQWTCRRAGTGRLPEQPPIIYIFRAPRSPTRTRSTHDPDRAHAFPMVHACLLGTALALGLTACGEKATPSEPDAAATSTAPATPATAAASPAAPSPAPALTFNEGPDVCFRAVADALAPATLVSEITSSFDADGKLQVCTVDYQNPADARKLVGQQLDLATGKFGAPYDIELTVSGDAASFRLEDYLMVPLSKVDAAALSGTIEGLKPSLDPVYSSYRWNGVRLWKRRAPSVTCTRCGWTWKAALPPTTSRTTATHRCRWTASRS